MTTCEECWVAANRAALHDGNVPDHYRRQLAQCRHGDDRHNQENQ